MAGTNWMNFLATMLLFITVTTFVFAFAAYFAFKLKQKRSPDLSQRRLSATAKEAKLFQAYVPEDESVSAPKAEKKRV
jgi:heme/copper-type cytochrome/quinol oxidase subunit 2